VPVDISIIVPVFDEEDSVLPLAREVAKALDKELRAFELVFVDDGSGDGTWEKIQEAHRIDPRVRGLRHAREQWSKRSALDGGFWRRTARSSPLWTATCRTTRPICPKCSRSWSGLTSCAAFGRIGATPGSGAFSSRIARWARKAALGVDFQDAGCSLRVFKRAALNGVLPSTAGIGFCPFSFMAAAQLRKKSR